MQDYDTLERHDVVADDLSTLALNASIELNELLLNQASDRIEIEKLAQVLQKTPDPIDNSRAFRIHMSPTDVDALTRALGEFADAPPKSNSELVSSARKLAETLHQIDEATDREDLARMLSSCLTLHEELSLRRMALDRNRKPQNKHTS